ncbi:UNVERIFIED_ORG: hypothetical protein ABIC48_001591 [Burkholderia territorii]
MTLLFSGVVFVAGMYLFGRSGGEMRTGRNRGSAGIREIFANNGLTH